jgi:hypothetical protein
MRTFTTMRTGIAPRGVVDGQTTVYPSTSLTCACATGAGRAGFGERYELAYSSQALDFDGVNDYVLIPDSPSNGDFSSQVSLEAWIRPDGYPGGGGDGFSCIVTKGAADWAAGVYTRLLTDFDLCGMMHANR